MSLSNEFHEAADIEANTPITAGGAIQTSPDKILSRNQVDYMHRLRVLHREVILLIESHESLRAELDRASARIEELQRDANHNDVAVCKLLGYGVADAECEMVIGEFEVTACQHAEVDAGVSPDDISPIAAVSSP